MIPKEIFKYSAIGVALIGALYIVYALCMGILALQTNDLNHMDESVKEQTKVLIRLEGKSDQQLEVLKEIRNKL